MRRAHCSLHLRDFEEALADTGRVLKGNKNNLEALELRGLAYYRMADGEMALRVRLDIFEGSERDVTLLLHPKRRCDLPSLLAFPS